MEQQPNFGIMNKLQAMQSSQEEDQRKSDCLEVSRGSRIVHIANITYSSMQFTFPVLGVLGLLESYMQFQPIMPLNHAIGAVE